MFVKHHGLQNSAQYGAQQLSQSAVIIHEHMVQLAKSCNGLIDCAVCPQHCLEQAKALVLKQRQSLREG